MMADSEHFTLIFGRSPLLSWIILDLVFANPALVANFVTRVFCLFCCQLDVSDLLPLTDSTLGRLRSRAWKDVMRVCNAKVRFMLTLATTYMFRIEWEERPLMESVLCSSSVFWTVGLSSSSTGRLSLRIWRISKDFAAWHDRRT
jgi:hypothetical protein